MYQSALGSTSMKVTKHLLSEGDKEILLSYLK